MSVPFSMNIAETYIRERVYKIVRQIPRGRVMTYGQIAELFGAGLTARTIVFLMHEAFTEEVPWHRVINSQGRCSTGKIILPYNVQQGLLEDEGIIFDNQGRCDLQKYLWTAVEVEQFAETGKQLSLFDFM